MIIALGEGRFEARGVIAGIESGDYVEIKQGLQEGEEIVISGQFLIDSEASMRASLMRMSPAQDDAPAVAASAADAAKAVMGSGIIKAFKSNENKINLQHDPIGALGWPSMTMDFVLDTGVSVDGLNINDSVMFHLEQRDDRYLITSIHKMAPGTSDQNGEMRP